MGDTEEVSEQTFQELVTLVCNRETKLPQLQAALEPFSVKQLRTLSGTMIKRTQAETEEYVMHPSITPET